MVNISCSAPIHPSARDKLWPTLAICLLSDLGSFGCALPKTVPQVQVAAPASQCSRAADMDAILRMAGEFEVTFSFAETDVLTHAYQKHADQRVAAREVVSVLERSDNRVVLQHILLIDVGDDRPHPMKHWRQDWTFEDPELLEFCGDFRWQKRAVDKSSSACAWSQAVFEITDAPRYESFGHWTHEGARSTWTSQETWRPLPRREHTQRSDYDVLIGTNRHVISKDGWVHEQDNRKHVLSTHSDLVRERGTNTYRRTQLEHGNVAQEYLERTGPFWTAVRQTWDEALTSEAHLKISSVHDGRPLYEALFPMADKFGTRTDSEVKSSIQQAIRPYLSPFPSDALAPR